MTSISPFYGAYIPSPPPPPPEQAPEPIPTNPDSTPREVEVIIVIAPAQPGDPYRPLLPYGGLSGAQENARRDMQFGMSSPEDRALMLGMNPYASAGELRDGDGDNTAVTSDVQEIMDLLPPQLKGEAARLALEAAAEELSNSLDFAVLGRAGENAVRSQLALEGWETLGSQVRVIVFDSNNKPTIRVYDFLARNAIGELTFLEVKTNGAIRSKRQTELDNNMMTNGGILATSRLGVPPIGSPLMPILVDVVQVVIERKT